MSSNPVVLEYENLQVRATDLSSLGPSGWLTGEIINFYLTYLETTEFNDGDILFMGTYMTYRLCHAKDSSIATNLSAQLEKDLSSKKIIIAPLNNRNHWSLLVYCRENCTYYYYDSIIRHNKDFALQASKKLVQFLDMPALREKKEIYFKSMYTPQQNNDHDCGIYVLAIAEELSRRFTNWQNSKQANLSTSTRVGYYSSSPTFSERPHFDHFEFGANAVGIPASALAPALTSTLTLTPIPTVTATGPVFLPSSHVQAPAFAPRFGGGYFDNHLQNYNKSRCDDYNLNRGARSTSTSNSSDRDPVFPSNFWRVIEEDIEYPKAMRIRIHKLVVSLWGR